MMMLNPDRADTNRRPASRSLVAGVLLAGMVAPVSAAPPQSMVVDALFWRPAGLVATAVGTGMFVGSLPFTAVTGLVRESAEQLVVRPFHNTFTRPLGETDYR